MDAFRAPSVTRLVSTAPVALATRPPRAGARAVVSVLAGLSVLAAFGALVALAALTGSLATLAPLTDRVDFAVGAASAGLAVLATLAAFAPSVPLVALVALAGSFVAFTTREPFASAVARAIASAATFDVPRGRAGFDSASSSLR